MKSIILLLFFFVAGNLTFCQTIHPAMFGYECPDKEVADTYFTLGKTRISNYFSIGDSLSLDSAYQIVVLYPPEKDAKSCPDSAGNRVLACLRNGKLLFASDSLLLKQYEYQSDPFRRMKKNENGFSIFLDYGSIIKNQYEMQFVYNGNSSFNLKHISCSSFHGGDPDVYDISEIGLGNYEKYDIRSINMEDYIIEATLIFPNE